MKTIGITGGVGSGKSAVLNYLKEKYDAYVIEADSLAKEAEEPGGGAYGPLTEAFGKDILGDDGAIDKKRFAALIFSDEEALKKANGIIHPVVKKMILEAIDRETAAGRKLFALEAALLIEDGYKEILDELWYIYAEEEVRFRRLEENRGYDREKSLSIMRRQLSDIEFRKYCDKIIDNGAELWEMQAQVDACLRGIDEKY
ncbi:MAG: dephospho-CoA kinase [Lachnospiraceae bacterium]|nr:dephospho-CoA kinase [Lachnospiraceae bacterium]